MCDIRIVGLILNGTFFSVNTDYLVGNHFTHFNKVTHSQFRKYNSELALRGLQPSDAVSLLGGDRDCTGAWSLSLMSFAKLYWVFSGPPELSLSPVLLFLHSFLAPRSRGWERFSQNQALRFYYTSKWCPLPKTGRPCLWQ